MSLRILMTPNTVPYEILSVGDGRTRPSLESSKGETSEEKALWNLRKGILVD